MHNFNFQMLLTKHMVEIDVLITIIEGTKLGFRTNSPLYLIGPNELLTQFQDIRLSLPLGTHKF